MSGLLARMRRNPAGDWKIADVQQICADFDLYCRPPTGGGSHFKVGHPEIAQKVILPYRRPIKPAYIRQLVALVDKVRNLR